MDRRERKVMRRLKRHQWSGVQEMTPLEKVLANLKLGREALIVSQALNFALGMMKALPDQVRPDSNITDLEALIRVMPKEVADFAETEIDTWMRFFRALSWEEAREGHEQAKEPQAE